MCLSVSYLLLSHRSVPGLFLVMIMSLRSLGNQIVVVTKEILHYDNKWMIMYFSRTHSDTL
jgi:hypothetical protein